MWGFYNSRNKTLADLIFNKIVDPLISKNFKKNNAKGQDQFFLAEHVYPLIKHNSIIHDSYTCKNFQDSLPFPSQRIGSCFIGSFGQTESCVNISNALPNCPIECRPKDNLDWIYC